MNILYNKKVKQLLNQAIEQGFTLTQNKKSLSLIPPNSKYDIVVIALTPSDFNVYYTIRRFLKRSGFKDE